MSEYLFVYGTLRADAAHPMHALLAAHGRSLGPAHMRGRLYRIATWPGAIESDDANDRVRGELYEVDGDETLWSTLDRYEGEGSLFERKRAAVTCGGAAYEAWVYLYLRSVSGASHIVNGDFLSENH